MQFICCYFIDEYGFVGFSHDGISCLGAFVSSQAHVQTMIQEARCPEGERLTKLIECMHLAKLPATSSEPMYRAKDWVVLAIASMIRDVDHCLKDAVAIANNGPRLDYLFVPREPGQEGGMIGLTTCHGSSITVLFYSRKQANHVIGELPWLHADERTELRARVQSSTLPETSVEQELTLSNPFIDYLNTGYTLSRAFASTIN